MTSGFLTQRTFFNAIEDKFTATELVEILDLSTEEIIEAFDVLILSKQSYIESELKYSR